MWIGVRKVEENRWNVQNVKKLFSLYFCINYGYQFFHAQQDTQSPTDEKKFEES
jgi:hypothetical protein